MFPIGTPPPLDPQIETDKQLNEYERAQEIALHTDTMIHEVTAIVWGANTLLIGFILEVKCEDNQSLVIVAALVGIVMTLYVPWAHFLFKISQRIAYKVCRDVENDLPLPHKLHNQINTAYLTWHPGLAAVWALTVVFIVAWLGIIVHAAICLCHNSAASRIIT